MLGGLELEKPDLQKHETQSCKQIMLQRSIMDVRGRGDTTHSNQRDQGGVGSQQMWCLSLETQQDFGESGRLGTGGRTLYLEAGRA